MTTIIFLSTIATPTITYVAGGVYTLADDTAAAYVSDGVADDYTAPSGDTPTLEQVTTEGATTDQLVILAGGVEIGLGTLSMNDGSGGDGTTFNLDRAVVYATNSSGTASMHNDGSGGWEITGTNYALNGGNVYFNSEPTGSGAEPNGGGIFIPTRWQPIRYC